MADDERRLGTLAELAGDPEGARELQELLENYRSLCERMDGAKPIIQALSASFALMSDREHREQYDAVRADLIRYLERLDVSSARSHAWSTAELRPEIVRSPAISREQSEALVNVLVAAAKLEDSKKG